MLSICILFVLAITHVANANYVIIQPINGWEGVNNTNLPGNDISDYDSSLVSCLYNCSILDTCNYVWWGYINTSSTSRQNFVTHCWLKQGVGNTVAIGSFRDARAMEGVDIPGYDYKVIDNSNEEECNKTCFNDTSCFLWIFRLDTNNCYLKQPIHADGGGIYWKLNPYFSASVGTNTSANVSTTESGSPRGTPSGSSSENTNTGLSSFPGQTSSQSHYSGLDPTYYISLSMFIAVIVTLIVFIDQ